MYPNSTSLFESRTSSDGPSAVAAVLDRIISVEGSQASPVRDVTFHGLRFAHVAPHYLGPYPTCGGGDFCAARAGVVVIEGAERVVVDGCEFDHPGGNGVCISNYNRNTTVSNNHLKQLGEVGIALIGSTDLINATGGNFPMSTKISGNLIHEVATKLRGGSFFFQSMAANTELSGNVAFNGPRAGMSCCKVSLLPALIPLIFFNT